MPCTAQTARCEGAQLYHLALPECCREHTRNLVFNVTAAAQAAGVRLWLDYGSLLGGVRNPLTTWKDYPWLQLPHEDAPLAAGILPHDKDADMGFLGEDWDKLLGIVPQWTPFKGANKRDTEVGYALGFEWVRKMVRNPLKKPGQVTFSAGDSIKVRLSSANHSNVDLFPWYDRAFMKEPNGMRHRYHFVSMDRYKGREFPTNKLLPLTEIMWEGRMLPAPADPQWFCQHRYGKAWDRPLKKNNDGKSR